MVQTERHLFRKRKPAISRDAGECVEPLAKRRSDPEPFSFSPFAPHRACTRRVQGNRRCRPGCPGRTALSLRFSGRHRAGTASSLSRAEASRPCPAPHRRRGRKPMPSISLRRFSSASERREARSTASPTRMRQAPPRRPRAGKCVLSPAQSRKAERKPCDGPPDRHCMRAICIADRNAGHRLITLCTARNTKSLLL